jgi:hypothetical protein
MKAADGTSVNDAEKLRLSQSVTDLQQKLHGAETQIAETSRKLSELVSLRFYLSCLSYSHSN